MMIRAMVLLYGLLAYFVALAAILYLIGFLGDYGPFWCTDRT